MDTQLTGKHALVCGASSGIGRATAMALGELGAQVTVLARRRELLDTLVAELEASGAVSPRAVQADLDDRVALGATIDGLLENAGPVHILVNNSGGPPGGPILQASEEAFLQAFGRHTLANHLLVRRCLPGMTEAGYGRIINVISTSVREPIPNLGVSNTIRGSVASWAKTVSGELPPGVTINNVLPGFTDTDRLGSLAKGRADRSGGTTEGVYELWRSQIPEGRLGRPDELASVIAFLASPAASYIRGVSLPVDGGRLRSI